MRLPICSAALLAALYLAACQDLPTVLPDAPAAAPAAGTSTVASAELTGVVTAPAGITAEGAAASFRITEVGEAPLGNAEVFLADAGGNAIPGIASVKTDADGKFTFKNAPKDFTFVVAAKAKTKEGKPALLQTLAKPGTQATSVEISAASTLVTAGVTQDNNLGDFNPATFKAALDSTRKQLTGADLPDLSDRAACVKRIGELATKVKDLATALAEIKQNMKDLRHDLEELKKQLANQPKAEAPRPDDHPPVAVAGDPPKQDGDRPAPRPSGDRPAPPPTARPTAAPSSAPITCEQAFKQRDTNGDGAVTLAEFLAFKPANGEVPNADGFRRVDANADGRVTLDELCHANTAPAPTPTPTARPVESPRPTATPTPAPTATPNACADAFKRRDLNADGTITAEEWMAYKSPNGEVPNLDAFKRLDVNADGKLTLQEMCGIK